MLPTPPHRKRLDSNGGLRLVEGIDLRPIKESLGRRGRYGRVGICGGKAPKRVKISCRGWRPPVGLCGEDCILPTVRKMIFDKNTYEESLVSLPVVTKQVPNPVLSDSDEESHVTNLSKNTSFVSATCRKQWTVAKDISGNVVYVLHKKKKRNKEGKNKKKYPPPPKPLTPPSTEVTSIAPFPLREAGPQLPRSYPRTAGYLFHGKLFTYDPVPPPVCKSKRQRSQRLLSISDDIHIKSSHCSELN